MHVYFGCDEVIKQRALYLLAWLVVCMRVGS